MPTYTIHYDRVTTKRQHRGVCSECGKTTTRSRTFEQTVNPFNRNDDGSVRTRREVWLAVNVKADEWVPDFTHERCMTP